MAWKPLLLTTLYNNIKTLSVSNIKWSVKTKLAYIDVAINDTATQGGVCGYDLTYYC